MFFINSNIHVCNNVEHSNNNSDNSNKSNNKTTDFDIWF